MKPEQQRLRAAVASLQCEYMMRSGAAACDPYMHENKYEASCSEFDHHFNSK